MKKSNFTVLEKNVAGQSSAPIASALIIGAALLFGNPSFAKPTYFRVVFENLPGTEEIEAGNLQAGIKALEDQLVQTELESSGDILATLCAAYIVNASMGKANSACNKAVKLNPTETAYNNRGVFRAHAGDLSGAREDFERIRLRQREAYREELRITNVPRVAANNFDLVNELLTERSAADTGYSFTPSTAAIEDLNE